MPRIAPFRKTLAPGQFGMKARADFEETAYTPINFNMTSCGTSNTRQNFE